MTEAPPAVRDCDRVRSTRPSHPGNTRSGHWPVAGSPSPTKSRRMTYTSPDSPPRRRPPSGRASPLAPTPPPRCSLSSGITLSGFARKPPLPRLCGACPVPASSGMTTGRHRLYRGGHRQANAALHRAVVVRMRYHQPTIDYVIRRRADGRTKRDIIRCLKRFLAREIYQRVMRLPHAPTAQ